jgi:NAD(P)-dependent dehydrogenase (short-subunit alcohol dehydrogenase family)
VKNNVVIGAVELTAEVMRQTFETNVFGTGRVLHALLPLLQRSTTPVVVNVSGLASLTRVTTDGTPGIRLPGRGLSGVKDRSQHDHCAVRESVPEHADQFNGDWLHQDRPQ